jgi:alpha-1,6-mannosyltransferase
MNGLQTMPLNAKGYRYVLMLLLLGCLQLIVYFNLYHTGNLGKAITAFIENYALLFAFYILTILFYRRYFSNGSSRPLRILLLLFPILFRILMILSVASLSTDIFRYMWDGMLLGNGVDPYRYVPSSQELDRFKSVSYFEAYDHKSEFTIYPPLGQFFFATCYLLFGNSMLGLKSLVSIVDLLNGLLIVAILMKSGGDTFRAYFGALVYLWNPLVIVEFSNSGHVDALAIFFLLLSIYCLFALSIPSSATLLAMSFLTKWIPAVTIPIFWKYFLNEKSSSFWKAVVSTALVTTIIVLPFYLSSGLGFIMSMAYFTANWRFESTLSRLIVFVGNFSGSGELFMAKVISYAIFIAIYVAVLGKARLYRAIKTIDCSILILALFYLITPAVYPWYATWLVALVSLTKIDLRTWIGVAFTGTAVVNYLQQFYPLSQTQFWVAYIIWFVPVFAIIGYYVGSSSMRNKLPMD